MGWSQDRIENYRQIALNSVNEAKTEGEEFSDFTICKNRTEAKKANRIAFFFGAISFLTSLSTKEFAVFILTTKRIILLNINYVGQILGRQEHLLSDVRKADYKQGIFLDIFRHNLKIQFNDNTDWDLGLAGGNYTGSTQNIINILQKTHPEIN